MDLGRPRGPGTVRDIHATQTELMWEFYCEREWGKKERKKSTERKKTQGPACLFRKAVGKRVGMGGSFLLMGPLHVSSDLAIGP